MTRRRICLFTAHSPLIGGGGAILRSLVANLPGMAVTWYYTAGAAAPGYGQGYLGPNLLGGGVVGDIWRTWKMLKGKRLAALDTLVERLLQADCESYWIVSHNEGIRIALELARHGRKVHLTIHDDWAGALCARSVRYRLMADQAKKLTVTVLSEVGSFDVISTGMQKYYERLSGRKGEICHRYLSEAAISTHKIAVDDSMEIRAGHLGAVYHTGDFIAFVHMFKEFAAMKGKKAVLQMWGSHLTDRDLPRPIRDTVRFYPGLPEEKVVPRLASCAFVYAMYPMAPRLKVFSQTSLPTKLTSYVQARRPLFIHAPADSSLAEFLDRTRTGVLWSSRSEEDGAAALNSLLTCDPGAGKWMSARERYFGERNLEVMNRVL